MSRAHNSLWRTVCCFAIAFALLLQPATPLPLFALAPKSKASYILEEKAIADLARIFAAKARGQHDDGYLQADFLYAISASSALSYVRQDRLFVRAGVLYIALRTGAHVTCVRFHREGMVPQDAAQPYSRRAIASADSLPPVVVEILSRDDFDRMDRGKTAGVLPAKPSGAAAGEIPGPGFVMRPANTGPAPSMDASSEEFLRLYESESARYLELIGRGALVRGDEIVRVLKQYFLIYLMRDMESAKQKSILAQFRSKNLLTPNDAEVIQAHLRSPPAETLSALAAIPPVANERIVESLYAIWLMGMFETVPVSAKLQQELANAICRKSGADDAQG